MGDLQPRSDLKILIERLKKEAEEHKADFRRMCDSLECAGIPMSSIGGEQRCHLNSLVATSIALNILTPDRVNLISGISDLTEELEKAEDMLEESRKRVNRYHTEELNILKQKQWWQNVLSEMNSKQDQLQSECNKAVKSTLFHSKKKAQYEAEIKRGTQALSSVGYEEALAHESLVTLGQEVQRMEENLKPLRPQMNSYKDLPPNITQARVKLQEKRIVFSDIDKELAEKLVDIAADATPVT